MSVLGIVLLVFFIIVSILLVFMVVIQDEGSDSLGGIFAGGSSSAFGSRSSNVLQKFTYVLGGLFFVLAFSLALINKTSFRQCRDRGPAQAWPGCPDRMVEPRDSGHPGSRRIAACAAERRGACSRHEISADARIWRS